MRHLNFFRLLGVVVAIALLGCGSSPNSANSSGGNSAAPGGPAAATEPAPAPPPPMVFDAGTTITVTLDQSLSSETSSAGDRFDASLARPLMENGQEVVPAGARVSGEVTGAKSAGRFKGSAELVVTLKSIAVQGRSYPIHTTAITKAGKGRGERTGIGVGGGAAAGAIIGAIAGGGKGAAIGAAAGGGAGTAGAALTGNRGITIPAETRMSFKLTGPLQVD
jgi:hypothetical protein